MNQPAQPSTQLSTSANIEHKDRIWSGRFAEPMDALMQRFNASVMFDKRLALVDIAGSLAHAKMLAKQKLISETDLADIERGLAAIRIDIASGNFEWRLDREDVHMNIEARLTEMVGDAGKRLHTARSRNDQVATDIRLWLRGEIDDGVERIKAVRAALIDLAQQHAATVMPGFTHMQVAQPVTFGHHLLAYNEMLARDCERMLDCRKRVNRMPLGSAALAGTTFPIDREFVAQQLGFEAISANSLDAVSDRDFAIEYTAAATLIMVHLSRFCEELIMWMSQSFAFIDLPDRFCTGSSIMPQKKNPDVAELIRGKSGRVVGHLMGLITLMKGQPLTYNKDNQEDKEPLFDTADTLADVLTILAQMVPGIQVKADNMRKAALKGFATATDLADYLVRKGVAFRDAHEVVARSVRSAEARGCDLADLTLQELQVFSSVITSDVHTVLTLEGSVSARTVVGGTAPTSVLAAAKRARELLLK